MSVYRTIGPLVLLRFGCFKHLLGIMYDHHILIFGQNSLLLHGGYLEWKDPMFPHFVFFLNKTLIKHLVFWGSVYRKEIFLFAIKRNFPQGGTPVKKYHSELSTAEVRIRSELAKVRISQGPNCPRTLTNIDG